MRFLPELLSSTATKVAKVLRRQQPDKQKEVNRQRLEYLKRIKDNLANRPSGKLPLTSTTEVITEKNPPDSDLSSQQLNDDLVRLKQEAETLRAFMNAPDSIGPSREQDAARLAQIENEIRERELKELPEER